MLAKQTDNRTDGQTDGRRDRQTGHCCRSTQQHHVYKRQPQKSLSQT